jgi:hypothetical protein
MVARDIQNRTGTMSVNGAGGVTFKTPTFLLKNQTTLFT